MTDQPYTPTTDDILRCYMQRGGSEEEFNLWYEAEIAATKQRGAERAWDEAIEYAWDDSAIYQADAARAKSKNPYRADRIANKEEGE